MTETALHSDSQPNTEPVSQLSKPEKRFQELTELLKNSKGQKHIIVLQNYPDPDAISTGLAHKIISASYGIETDIFYSGQISHPENIALVKLLDIELKKWDAETDISSYDGAVFVDNQGTTAGTILGAIKEQKIRELVIVDHHETQEGLNATYKDIRKVGATATIYADYLERGIIAVQKQSREHVAMATALMHGIKTDTAGFVTATNEDFKAAAFLSHFVDSDLLSQITSQSRSKQAMEIIQQTLFNRSIKESFSIAGIGYVRAEDRDVIPQAADFILSEENIHTAIVFGVVSCSDQESEVIIGSMRTSKLTIDPDEFIKEVFGKDANGRYFGGGKKTAGGFEIPMGFLSGGNDKEYRELKWKVYKAQILQKLLNKIGVEHEEVKKDELIGTRL